MIRLRPYKPEDSKYLIHWITKKHEFSKWCANKFTYPLTIEQLEEYYHSCEKDGHSWIMAAINEEGIIVGHLLMRKADYINESIHLGFVIVDPTKRGKGMEKK